MNGALDLELHPKQGAALLTLATELGYGGAAGGGKMVALNTRIPTPSGYVLLSDLRVGEELFDEHGNICRVTHLHPIDLRPKSYRLTFDNRQEIEACADHQWLTYNLSERAQILRRSAAYRDKRKLSRPSRAKADPLKPWAQKSISAINRARQYEYEPLPSGTIRTTQEIFDTLKVRGRVNHSIPVARPLELSAIDLPLDPYCLGAWLGDGTTISGGLTGLDPEVWEQFEICGFAVTHRTSKASAHYVRGLVPALRELGVLGNKHVPAIYLRASIAQRLALLQGLMDTDGTCDKDGSVEFTNTNRRLSEAVYDLVSGLGWKAYWQEGRARLNGDDCGAKYEVKFSPDKPVFRIKRKLDRLRLDRRQTNRFHYIVKCEPIDPIPMRCISVDSPSRLFLISKSFIPTHNSHIGRASAIYFSYLIPGLQTYLFRRTSNELTKNHMLGPTSFPAMLAEWVRKDFARIVKNEIRFGNGPSKIDPFDGGSRIFLCHCQHEKDVFNWLGPEMHYLIIEQAEQFTPFMIQMLRGRNRIPEALNIPDDLKPLFPRCLYTFNPGGVGHAFFKEKFVRALKRGADGISEIVEQPDHEGGKRRQFIQAKLDDNPSVNPVEYRKTLRGLPPRMAKALEEGDFDQVIGAFFPEVDRRAHLIRPVTIQPHWTRFMGMDWGACGEGDPFSIGWWVVVAENTPAINTMGEPFMIPRNSLVCYRSWYGKGLPKVTATQVAQGIIRRESGEVIAKRVAGGDIEAKRGTGPSIFELFRSEGIHFSAADQRRQPGHLQFRERLVGKEGIPRIYWVETCADELETIANLQHDPHNANDCTDNDDHVYEQCRYVCMARPWAGDQVVEQQPIHLGNASFKQIREQHRIMMRHHDDH